MSSPENPEKWMKPEDLAPGDRECAEREWGNLELYRVASPEDERFPEAYRCLWEEFGEAGEMEDEEVIHRRLAWGEGAPEGGWHLRYRLMLALAGGKPAAVRDHTAIVRDSLAGAVVHMSHNLVAPEWRRTGLAGWMRALPLQTARHALQSAGHAPDEPITLVGEMEHPNPSLPMSIIRLKAYEKAGFKKVDPSAIRYLQPDFRSPDQIDASGGACGLPLSLVIRQVGRESENSIWAGRLREIVQALYAMYARSFRPEDMRAVHESLALYPDAGTQIRLVPPTQP